MTKKDIQLSARDLHQPGDTMPQIGKDTFCEKQTSEFEAKQERKILALNDRAHELGKRLGRPEYATKVYENLVETMKKDIRNEWSVLFGAKPDKMFAFVDLDCFYAAVEMLNHPEYRKIPIAVGSKMMIATCNYNARRFGVRSGMPGYRALSLCPRLLIVNPNMGLYKSYSEKVMTILRSVDEEIEVYGIDEACLIIDSKKLERGECILKEYIEKLCCEEEKSNLIDRISDQNENFVERVYRMIDILRIIVFLYTGLTASSGISVCRGLAKLASNMKKPNGQFIISEQFDDYLLHLGVDEINGIGKVTKETLQKTLGIQTIRDLREKICDCAKVFNRRTLYMLLKNSYGLIVHDTSLDPKFPKGRLSYSISRTILNPKCGDVMDCLWAFSQKLSDYLNGISKKATLLTLSIKYKNFDIGLKQKRYKLPFQSAVEIFDRAIEIMDSIFESGNSERWIFKHDLRLVGLTVGKLVLSKNINRLEFNISEDKLPNTIDVTSKQMIKKIQRKIDEFITKK